LSKINQRLVIVLCGWILSASSDLALAAEAKIIEPPADPALALKLPAGFKANIFAKLKSANSDHLKSARFMAFGPDGSLYVAMVLDNKVVMLPDSNHDGIADEIVTVADKLNAPNAVDFLNDQLLVSNQDGVVRLNPKPKLEQMPKLEQNKGQWPAASITPVISGLATGGHTLKTIKVGPDGFLYINVGSSCNVCVEENPLRATILRYTAEGKPAGALKTLGRHAQSPVWATGLRNSQGFAWHPVSGAMFATNEGADMRSDAKGGAVNDEVPPEHLNRIETGKNYGWPHCWTEYNGTKTTDPNFSGDDGFCATAQAAEITFRAHSTPLGITFLDKTKFPAEYKTDAIVALHGSWNRKEPDGYKLVRMKFKQDKAVEIVDFATGWLDKQGAWGRPVDVIVGPDGALYVSDDRAGLVYRITYGKN
jgi:glucose/arabinose dehydrogenase